MENSKQFIQFMYLNRDVLLGVYNKTYELTDYILDDYILIRVYDKFSVIFLGSGTVYEIPIEYINIFIEYIFYKDSANYGGKSGVDIVIKNFLDLAVMFQKKFKNVDSKDLMMSISSICKEGTREIMDIIYNELDIYVPSLLYESIKTDKLI